MTGRRLSGLLCLALLFGCNGFHQTTKLLPGNEDGNGSRPPFDDKPTKEEETAALDILQGNWRTDCLTTKTADPKARKRYSLIVTEKYFRLIVDTYQGNDVKCSDLGTRALTDGLLQVAGYDRNNKRFRIRLGKNYFDFKLGASNLKITGVGTFSLAEKPETTPYRKPVINECPDFRGHWQNGIQDLEIGQNECNYITHYSNLSVKEYYVDGIWWSDVESGQLTKSTLTANEMWVERKSSKSDNSPTKERHLLTKSACNVSGEDIKYVIEQYDGNSSQPTKCTAYSKK